MVRKIEIESSLGSYKMNNVVIFDDEKISADDVMSYVRSGVESYKDYFVVLSSKSYNLIHHAVQEKCERDLGEHSRSEGSL